MQDPLNNHKETIDGQNHKRKGFLGKSNIHGRPKGSKKSDKDRMLVQLKKIWNTQNNKASDIIAACSLHADLTGLKVKNAPNESTKEIMKIEFTQKSISPNEIKPLVNIENKNIISHNENIHTKNDCPDSATLNNCETKSNVLSDTQNTQLDSEPVISSSPQVPVPQEPVKNNLENWRERQKREKEEERERLDKMIHKMFPEESEVGDFKEEDNPFKSI